MRVLATFIGLTLALAAGATAQERPRFEIGTALGVTITVPDGGGDNITSFGIPGGATVFTPPPIYVSIFATPNVMIEPQISFLTVSGSGESETFFSGVAQLGYLFTPERSGSPYVAAHAGVLSFSNGSSESNVGIGGGVGYRVAVGTGLAVRFEGRVRKWTDESSWPGRATEWMILLGIGGVIR